MTFEDIMIEDKKIVEIWIEEYINALDIDASDTIKSAMKYSLESGGKRLRPVLLMETFKLFDDKLEYIKPFGFSLEAIHTYSLIHDDLPAMDNDDFRRGKPTNHKVFGEAIAILAGDALLNYAMETLINEIKDSKTLEASKIIANFAGISGMIGGQVIDIESENQNISYDVLKKLHEKKTGKLIMASVLSGAILADASKENIKALKTYATQVGLAFQITDDILDVIGNQEELGKPIGSDKENHKVTYVSLFGLEKAQKLAKESTERAIKAIEDINNNGFFVDFANYIINRKS